jgi:RIP metalloprotease RseP
MIVFMIGVQAPAPIIGLVAADSPAERVGIRVNDKITRIDGQLISDFKDVMPAVLLAVPGETLKVEVKRPMPDGGWQDMTFNVPTQHNPEENKLMIGIAPQFSTHVMSVMEDPRLPEDEQLRAGDIIQEVNGKKVTDLFELNLLLARQRGQFADLKVLRTDKDGKEQVVHVKRRARLVFRPTDGRNSQDQARETGHLLGLVPRIEVTIVNKDERAYEAGLRPGDVIVKWGQQTAPTRAEIVESIRQNPERAIPVTVLRTMPDGSTQELKLQVTPKQSGLFRDGRAKTGMDPDGQESDRLIVADIITKMGSPAEDIPTPAAKIKDSMPRGSLITRVNDEPVKTWPELVQKFIELAGTDVKLTWTFNDQSDSATIHIPQTLGTVFPLLPGERVTKIAGENFIEKLVDGRPVQRSPETWAGSLELLRKHMGKTIEVEYRYPSDAVSKKATVTVTPEMLDTWVQRTDYTVVDTMLTDFVNTTVRVRNPLAALGIGIQKTYYFVEQVYVIMKRMLFTRSVSFDQVSGPIGIVKMGSDVAAQNFVDLLYFLAIISANLALINFLPLPIVDGGLFMFLIIEKIKGSPISLRVMVATQVIGIVLIIGVFLFVTFQDLQKLFG